MASCQINITGTTGEVLIRYKLSSIQNSITAGIGDAVYISDTATDITYSTLSGDAIAASGCVTITSLPRTCYLFQWQTEKFACNKGDVFNGLILGATTYPLTEVNTSSIYSTVAESIKNLNNSLILPTAGKVTVNSDSTSYNYLILTISGSDVPRLRINNPTTSFKTYLIGETTTCLPAGYTTIETCVTEVST